MRCALLAVVLAGLLAGCMENERTLQLRIIEEGAHAAVREASARILLVGDAAAFADLHGEIHAGTLPRTEPPPVDFDAGFVLAAFMGRRSTGGYSISLLESASQHRGTVTVTLDWRVPPDDAVLPQVMTAPYVLAFLPRGDYRRVEVVRDDERIAVIEVPGVGPGQANEGTTERP